MLRPLSERHDSGQPSATLEEPKTWNASSPRQGAAIKSTTNHRRKPSPKARVTFQSQLSSDSASQAQRTKTTTTVQRPSRISTNITPLSKRHKAFASLFVSFLATSSIAIEIDAADQKTVESANKASSTPLPPPLPKAYTESTSRIKASEIRKTRWKRFKYEVGLRMKSGQKGKQRERNVRLEGMGLTGIQSQEVEQRR